MFKRLKEYVKRQKVAEVRAEKEQKKFLKNHQNGESVELINGTLSHTNGVTTFKGRMKPSPTYSDIVGTATKRHHVGILGKKALARRAVDDFKVVEVSSVF